MRGKPLQRILRLSGGRITPADAGKTLYYRHGKGMPKDHPRGCGENVPTATAVSARTGSPPRMRGKRHSQILAAV